MLNMHRISIVPIVAATLLVATESPATAQMPSSMCRWSGIGWSDGYHSHTACPPKPHAVHRAAPPVFNTPVAPIAPVMVSSPAAKPTPVPWWKIPASERERPAPEPMPAPMDSVVTPDTP
jgi:hypothetical protein